jgi:hypothetical protein
MGIWRKGLEQDTNYSVMPKYTPLSSPLPAHCLIAF